MADRIYVCFVCEQEFFNVQKLSEHMLTHEEIGEAVPEKKKKRPRVEAKSLLDTQHYSDNWKSQVEPTLKKKPYQLTPAVMAMIKKNSKPILNEEELALQRALKVQKLIKIREMSTPKSEPKSKDTPKSNQFGPTVITAEPEGFICPKNRGVESPTMDIIMQMPIYRKRGRHPNTKKHYDIKMDQNMDHVNITKVEGSMPPPMLKDTNQYQCPECLNRFASAMTLKAHQKSHEVNKEIVCPFCEDVFHQRYLLQEHIMSDHGEIASNLCCSICGKVFTRQDSLKSHMVRMHYQEGGVSCMVCGKHFPTQATLETHFRVHTGERPFKCVWCEKSFVQKIHLRTHLKKMHDVDEMMTTPCRICDEMLDDRQALREHHMAVHDMTYNEYKHAVAKLKRGGHIPDSVPHAVKIVEPNFSYQKVSSNDFVAQNQSYVKTNVKPRIKKGKSIHVFPDSHKKASATIMDPLDNMFSAGSSSFQSTSRDEEELKLVESAFKVAEEMDYLNDGSSLMMSPQDVAPNMFYSINGKATTSKEEDCTLEELRVVEVDGNRMGEFGDDFGEISKFESIGNIQNIKVESL